MTKLSTMGMSVLTLLLVTFPLFVFWWMIEFVVVRLRRGIGQCKKEEDYLADIASAIHSISIHGVLSSSI